MVKLSSNQLKKVEIVKSLVQTYSETDWIFLFRYKGLNATENFNSRSEMRKIESKILVVKNKLNVKAFKDSRFSSLVGMLSGQVAVVMAKDPVATAKVLNKYVQDKKIEFLGYSNGDKMFASESLVDLASLPSVSVLRARFLGTLMAPGTSLARVINEVPTGLARVMNNYSQQK